jgi:hypothetical protein
VEEGVRWLTVEDKARGLLPRRFAGARGAAGNRSGENTPELETRQGAA